MSSASGSILLSQKILKRDVLGNTLVILIILVTMCVSASVHAQGEDVVEILYSHCASGPHKTGDVVEIVVPVRNLSNESQLIFVGLTFRNQKGTHWDVPPRPMLLRSRERGAVTFVWTVPQDAPSGEYDILLAAWKGVNGTLMVGKISSLTIERSFSVIGPPVRAGDILFFALTIVPRLLLSLYRREEERSSAFIWADGATCHAFALILWNVPFKTDILRNLFWIYVIWGYLIFLAVAFRDELVKRRRLILVSLEAPSSLMIGTLFYLYYGNDLTILMSTSIALFVIFNSRRLTSMALQWSRRIRGQSGKRSP